MRLLEVTFLELKAGESVLSHVQCGPRYSPLVETSQHGPVFNCGPRVLVNDRSLPGGLRRENNR